MIIPLLKPETTAATDHLQIGTVGFARVLQAHHLPQPEQAIAVTGPADFILHMAFQSGSVMPGKLHLGTFSPGMPTHFPVISQVLFGALEINSNATTQIAL